MNISELKEKFNRKITIGEAYENDVNILSCDNCGKEICCVKEFDLNESYFYCFECIKREFSEEFNEKNS